MPFTPHAVLLGKDEMLNLTRRWILERAGFVVLAAQGASEAELLLRQHTVDLLVLCYGISEQDCLQIAMAMESAGTSSICKVWLGRIGACPPDYLPQDMLATSGDPHELYLAALQTFSQLTAGGKGA